MQNLPVLDLDALNALKEVMDDDFVFLDVLDHEIGDGWAFLGTAGS